MIYCYATQISHHKLMIFQINKMSSAPSMEDYVKIEKIGEGKLYLNKLIH